MMKAQSEKSPFGPDRAMELAAIGYNDETEHDKFGGKKLPYSDHPRRLEEVFNTPEMVALFGQEAVTTLRSIALLHDIYKSEHGNDEVTEKTLVDEGASQAVLDGVDAMSKRDDQETPEEHIARIKKNFLASVVDIADIGDNREGKSLGKRRKKRKANDEKYDKKLALLIEGDEQLTILAPIILARIAEIYTRKDIQKHARPRKVPQLALLSR